MKPLLNTTLLALLLVIGFSGGVSGQDFEETKRLAEQGNANAQYNLGFMYANGDGVPENYAEAVRWFRLSAEQGNARAQTLLVAAEEKEIWACQGTATAGLDWVDGNWKENALRTENYLLTVELNSLGNGSFLKWKGFDYELECRRDIPIGYPGRFVCSNGLGIFVFMDAATGEGGIAHLYGTTQPDQGEGKDTAAVVVVQCSKF